MPRPHPAWPALLLALAAAPALAQPVTGRWSGTIRCEPIPGVTRAPLTGPFTLTASGGAARYERPIMDPNDTNRPTAYVERGEGRIGPDGALRLTGGAQGQTFRYTAAYQGRLVANAPVELTGSQDWSGARAGQRACTISLRPG